MKTLESALKPLVDIADRYDRNELDDEARKFWGHYADQENPYAKKPAEIVLYSGRGGATLLTLQDCFDARETYNRVRDDLK